MTQIGNRNSPVPITAAQLQDGLITASKIANGQITEEKVANNAITSSKIADGEVTESKLANNAITSSKIADGEVTESKVANNAITASKIADGEVTESKLANNVVDKLVPDVSGQDGKYLSTNGTSLSWEVLEVVPEILTTAERLALSNTSLGKLVFDTDIDKLHVYNGSEWEQIISGVDGDFDVPLSFDTLNLGNAVCGGFYIGAVSVGSQCYALIVAPNATGCACCQWKTTRTATSGTTSCVDGFNNTYGPMDNADHPAGNWTATRTINGFSDWYLPARDELNQLYVNKGTTPAGEGFAADSYWSSTEDSATLACRQNFNSGNQTYYIKTSIFRVRAVRREPI
jgi:hypothetical protein